MRITQIDIYQLPVKLKEPFIISLGPLYAAENVVIVIHTDTGLKGFGECSPFKTIHGESMETCFVVANYLATSLINADPVDIDNCHKRMNGAIYGNSSIKSAFDIALYDIAAQDKKLPLYEYLGGENTKPLFTDYTVSIGTPEKMSDDALLIKENGYSVIKVKLGGSADDDIKRIKFIREKVGYDIPLRIDANQGWNTESAIHILEQLIPYQIQHCEEPVNRNLFMSLPQIRVASSIPIMADESCFDHHDAQRLIQLKACDLFNIKLGKSSGIFNALKIIHLAESQNMNLQVGGFLESRLGFTASAHLALCSENIIYCDFDTPLMFSEDPVTGGIEYKEKGRVVVPSVIGLGATIEESYLKGLKNITIK